MIQSAIGPLTDAEQTHIADLVSRGFKQWQSFHDEYAEQRRQIVELDPGSASWSDLSAFAQMHLSASQLDGYYAIGFDGIGDAVQQAPKDAHVLTIGGKAYACGDYGGMPVQHSSMPAADRLGTNVPVVTKAIRQLAFPEAITGAAQIRWSDDAQRPAKDTFGLVFAARQTVRSENGTFSERALSLHGVLVETSGHRRLENHEIGPILRCLQSKNTTARQKADEDSSLRSAIQTAEAELVASLRRPSDQDRKDGVSHGVFPLFAAVVG
jgi:hypothetical protein